MAGLDGKPRVHLCIVDRGEVNRSRMRVDRLWRDVRLATMTGDDLGVVEGGLLAARAGVLVYAGPAQDAPAMDADETIPCDGRWVTPGLIDCHTHLVFGGDRVGEWRARLAGRPYGDLAEGGGIRATVQATRSASDAALHDAALQRLDLMIAQGVTTIEIKSGYGLDIETELRQLRIARGLARARPVRVLTSLLAAHAMPPDGSGNAEAYIGAIVENLLPRVVAEQLADAVDGFCETIAFTPAAIARLFAAAQALGLPLKLHADQLSDGGGAALAARFGALSADHLEFTSHDGVAAMARAGTVAVLLPGAYYVLREIQRPPIAALRKAGVPIAVGTDCNPGTSPLVSPLLAMHLAATLLDLTPVECLRGMTCNAARALGLHDRVGTLAPGLRADVAVWSVAQPAEMMYWLGGSPLWRRDFAA